MCVIWLIFIFIFIFILIFICDWALELNIDDSVFVIYTVQAAQTEPQTHTTDKWQCPFTLNLPSGADVFDHKESPALQQHRWEVGA